MREAGGERRMEGEAMGSEREYERSIDELGDEIATLAANIHAATYRLLVLIAEFDERDGWSGDVIHGPGAFSSTAHWLMWRTGLSMGAAREKVRTARALRELPKIAASMERGELSFSKVRAMTRVANLENEEELLEFAQVGTTAHLESLVRGMRQVQRSEELALTERRHEERKLLAFFDDDGMLVIRGRLEPEMGAMVLRALEAAEDSVQQSEDDDSSPTQRRADALGAVAEAALASDSVTTGDQHQVVVHVNAGVLADANEPGISMLEDWVGVSAETSQRLCCDGSKVEITVDDAGNPLHLGRKTRVISTPLRRALRLRDGHCQFPGCTHKRCDAHHIRHWGGGGETNLENLVLLCRRHHRAVHEGGFRVEARGDDVVFYWPHGEVMPGAARMRERGGLEKSASVGPETCLPEWQGERFNRKYAVEIFAQWM